MKDELAVAKPPAFYFECPLCGRALDVRLSKKGKPYVTCDQCSLQMFVRGPAGITRFGELAHASDGRRMLDIAPKRLPPPKGRPGRPRKASTEQADRLAQVPPVSVLLTRRMA